MRVGIVLAGLVLMGTMGFSQSSNYGSTPEDSIQCVQNYSLYTEFFKQKNYADAIGPWRKVVFQYCPKLSKSLYQNGGKMYKRFIKDVTDDAAKAGLIDTLLMLYDLRTEYYGQKCFVLGRKGNDMLKYRRDEPTAAFNTLKEVFEICEGKMEAGALVSLYKALYLMYKTKEIPKEQLLEWYPRISDAIDMGMRNAKKEKDVNRYRGAQENIDKVFSIVASCEDSVNLFGPKFEAAPDDTTLMQKALKTFEKRECTGDDLYNKMAKALCAVKPSCDCAYGIANWNASKNDCKAAVEYYKQAAELCVDTVKRYRSLIKAAKCYLKLGQYATSKSFSIKAAAVDPGKGEAYLLMASAFAASESACGDNPCMKKAVYWLAGDYCGRARSIESATAEEANKKIASYKAHWPGKEDCFFHNITEGNEVTIGCWINEKTKARFIK